MPYWQSNKPEKYVTKVKDQGCHKTWWKERKNIFWRFIITFCFENVAIQFRWEKMQYHSKNVEEKREKNVFINNNFSNKYQYLNKQHTWEKSLDKKWKEEFCQFLFNSKFIYFCMLLRPSNIDYMPITFQIDFFRHTHAHAVVDAPW